MTRGAGTTGRADKKPSRKAVTPRREPKTDPSIARSQTRKLNEALQREAATAEVLRIISSAPNDTQAVFDAIVGSSNASCSPSGTQSTSVNREAMGSGD